MREILFRGKSSVTRETEGLVKIKIEWAKCGEWEKAATEYGVVMRCSVCHFQYPDSEFKYCPNCGAEMGNE